MNEAVNLRPPIIDDERVVSRRRSSDQASLKVLHVVPSLAARTGGPAVVAVESSLAIASCGIDASIVTTDLPAIGSVRGRASVSLELPDGADQVDVQLYRCRPPQRLAFSPQLYQAVQHHAATHDVIHVHSLWLFPQFAGFLAAKRHDAPLIVSPHGALDPWLQRRGRLRKRVTMELWQRRMLEQARFIHVTSPVEGELISNIAPATPRAVVPYGIYISRFANLPDPAEFCRKWLGSDVGQIVLCLGRVAAKKNLDTLIRAFARAVTDETRAVLVIVGPDDENLVGSLRALADARGVGERTVFTGMLTGRDKLAALAAADIWALPSYTENFGVAVVEALAAGKAAILSDAINIAGDAAAAGAAVVVEPTEHAFGAALRRLLGDRDQRVQLSVRARVFAQRYDWRVVAPQLAEMYRAAAKSSRSSRRRFGRHRGGVTDTRRAGLQ